MAGTTPLNLINAVRNFGASEWNVVSPLNSIVVVSVSKKEAKMKRMICLAALVLSLVVFPLTIQAGPELKTVKMVIPRGSVFVLSYYGARDAGIFRKHGIDAEVDARPFAGFMAGLPSRQVLVATYAGLNGIEQMNEGKDLVMIGGGITHTTEVLGLK